jgi:hypothetical protein
MAEVQAERIDTRVEQVPQHKWRSTCRADCGNNLGASISDHLISFGLARAGALVNKHSAKVIYICQGRSRSDQVARSVEQGVAVVVGKMRLGGCASALGARQNIRPYYGSGRVFCAVNAISVCRDGMNIGVPVQCNGNPP